MSDKLDKADIQKLINLKSERISYENSAGKSVVWKFFQIIVVDGKSVPFVACNKCQTLLRWKSCDGTNGLRAHTDYCSTQRGTQQKLAAVPGFMARPKVPSAVKSDVTDAIVSTCAKDLRCVFLT